MSSMLSRWVGHGRFACTFRSVANGARNSVRQFSATTNTPEKNYTFNADILKFVVCPISGGELRYDSVNERLISEEVGVAYPIQSGIPLLIPEEGIKLDASNTPSSSS